MLTNLLIGLTTMVACLIVQGILVVAALRYFATHYNAVNATIWGAMRVTTGLMLLLIVGNLAQVAVWGLVFYLLGEFEDFATAFYHSGVNFATLGYGDMVMSERHRLLGPLESINGVLMIGISTAALSRAFAEAVKVRTRRAVSPSREGGRAD